MASFSLGELSAEIVERVPFIASIINGVPPLHRLVNRMIIDGIAGSVPPRPLPYSLWCPNPDAGGAVGDTVYTSWPGLVDRSFTGRHLGPMRQDMFDALPPLDDLRPLFQRRDFRRSPRTSALFCFFVQWFTDSFLRTHPTDKRKNTSNHEIDLCQIYGLGEESTRMLRAGVGGRLKSRIVECGEFPELLADPQTLQVKQEFAGITYDPISATSFDDQTPPHGSAAELRQTIAQFAPWAVTDERWRCHYAAGLERANSTIIYSAINTIFLREHNRLAALLHARFPDWDDDRLFETARNINIVILLKIIVEDYINHLASSPIKLSVEQGFADRRHWYRTNRIALEFNLLYRWHAMVPDALAIEGSPLKHTDFRYNNALLERLGVEAVIDEASRQAAGEVRLFNTPVFLVEADMASMRLSRQFRLKPLNDYREHWGLARYDSLEQLVGGDAEVVAALRALYPDRAGEKGIDRVELPIGLLAERRSDRAILPETLLRMVGSDAFSQALTNPLLAAYVFGPECFTEVGIAEIGRTNSFRQVVLRNLAPGAATPTVTFTLGAG